MFNTVGQRCSDTKRYHFALFLFAVCAFMGCGGCNDDTLIDISCKPGNPAEGQYDADLPERCDNLIDDNCDGQVNEGCDCLDGEEQTCGDDIGACRSTTVTCVDGHWPECVPRVSPRAELCDGVDNDCDGDTDEGFSPIPCFTGPDSAILDGTTSCREGLSVCENGRWSECMGQVLPQQEVCDNVDNDCDGEVDDDTNTDGLPCGPVTQTGQCLMGVSKCFAGESICLGAVFPQTESCDGVDNDCDGTRDEDLYRPCQSLCGEGVETCHGGRWEDCSAPDPEVEHCDGVDNDCDGEIDEGCPCYPGIVAPCVEGMVDQNGDPATCGIGLMQCDDTSQWGPCVFAGTAPESCNNWDDDCDDEVDGITEDCGDPYTAGIGICQLGQATCTNGVWGQCVGEVEPEDEVCDQQDNDCDGDIDEDLDPHDKVDMVFAIDISGSMCPYIQALAAGIGAYVTDFQGTDHRFAIAVFPGYGYNDILTLNPNLTDVNAVLAALLGLDCNGGGSEPGYDVLLRLTDPANPEGIAWRSDAYPYIVYITDEPAQTWNYVLESSIAQQTSNCGLPGCVSGDKVEIAVITNMNYMLSYDDVVYGELDRIYEIEPPDAGRYTAMLRDIFADVCTAPPTAP